MLRIDNVSSYGWREAIHGMRNPMNSWEKSDSELTMFQNHVLGIIVGDSDFDLMKRLAKAGSADRKFMRMITVYVDVTAPLYWWKEMDTYKVGTVRDSCSTMHKITSKEFTLDDFSHEHLKPISENNLIITIKMLNTCRYQYTVYRNKDDWWQIIQLLPSSYNQKSTLMLNYEVLSNIYHQRKNHKLDEWHVFCGWIKTLPYSELITGEEN
jgi:hypothetical protein